MYTGACFRVYVAQEAASPSPPGGGISSAAAETSNGFSRTHFRQLSCLVSSGGRYLHLEA